MSTTERAGRMEPYTERGIGRMKCVRCGEKARFQWSACADGNLQRPICARCDVLLNELALTFMGDPDVEQKISAYRELKGIPA